MGESTVKSEQLIEWVRDARQRSIDLVNDLSDQQLIGPKLPTVNPLVWEIGHAAWFQEHWVLQHACGHDPIRADLELLYDSIGIEHDVRWDLPLLSREDAFSYVREVCNRVVDVLASRSMTNELKYFVQLSVFHEDMHTEAFTYTRQTLAYPPPAFQLESRKQPSNDPLHMPLGDVEIPSGTFQFGAAKDEPFVFDNEKWAHTVEVKPFAISRATVTQNEFAAFVEEGGYERREWWSDDGWSWREENSANHPIFWRRESNGQWLRRDFDRWVALEPNRPVLHVNWYEAEAYCRWAKRRLPSELEWEVAASTSSTNGNDRITEDKRRYPWGNDPPNAECANFDWQTMGAVDVAELAAGDSAFGCRQMLGNVWEWTATTFGPFPGFVVDPYKEYSRSCFGECKVLRGGCWATRGRLMRNTWRNFYRPDRRDVWAGFRTCAVD